MQPTTICGLIPAYNAESTLKEVIEGTRKHLAKIIVVNDGSFDRTGSVAAACGVPVVTNLNNMGKGASLQGGFDFINKHYPECEAILTLDADGQHLPSEIPSLLEAYVIENADLVIGARDRDPEKMPRSRAFGNWMGAKFVSLAAGRKLPDTQSGFRIYRRSYLQRIELTTRYFDTESELIIAYARRKAKIISVPIQTIYNKENYKTHFRTVVDFLRIGKVVLKGLFSRMLFWKKYK